MEKSMNVKTLAENLTAFEQSELNTLTITQNRQPLTSAHSYYRSKFYTPELDINPLIQAAAPLFSLTAQYYQKNCTDLQALHQELVHEVKAFESLAQQAEYSSHEILAARYAICCLLDETISKTSKNQEENWKKHSLLATFQRENYGGERFFVILQRSLEDPRRYTDLLELFYLCLRYEYQGEHINLPNGHQQLKKITRTLYQAIRHQRGEFSKRLFITQPIIKKSKRKKIFFLSIFIIITTLLIGSGIYSSMKYQLHKYEHNTIGIK